MDLPAEDRTVETSGFVSIVTTMLSASFAIWLNKENHDTGIDTSSLWLLDKFIEDKDTKNKLAHDLATMADNHAQELALAQIEVLKADAKGGWFQASWRPLIGWICGLSLGINYMVAPIAAGSGVMIPQADMS